MSGGTRIVYSFYEGVFNLIISFSTTMANIRSCFYAVLTDVEGKRNWQKCFKVDGVQLPTGYYLGLSAATGDLSDNHEVVSVKFYELETEVRCPPLWLEEHLRTVCKIDL